eukprot:SAG11_NODE_17161_length_526_cov_1.557377_1_plen_73_part_10
MTASARPSVAAPNQAEEELGAGGLERASAENVEDGYGQWRPGAGAVPGARFEPPVIAPSGAKSWPGRPYTGGG